MNYLDYLGIISGKQSQSDCSLAEMKQREGDQQRINNDQ